MPEMLLDEIYRGLKGILVDDFEISPENIFFEANLFEDLELDSIDAVDLAVRLQQYTNKKVAPEEFKKIKTVGDVVKTIQRLMQEKDETL